MLHRCRLRKKAGDRVMRLSHCKHVVRYMEGKPDVSGVVGKAAQNECGVAGGFQVLMELMRMRLILTTESWQEWCDGEAGIRALPDEGGGLVAKGGKIRVLKDLTGVGFRRNWPAAPQGSSNAETKDIGSCFPTKIGTTSRK